MIYSVHTIQEEFAIVAEEMYKWLQLHNVKVGKDGLLSKKVCKTLLSYFAKEPVESASKPIYVLRGLEFCKLIDGILDEPIKLLFFYGDLCHYLIKKIMHLPKWECGR